MVYELYSNGSGKVPLEYEDLKFFFEHLAFTSWSQYLALPDIHLQKWKEYQRAENEGL